MNHLLAGAICAFLAVALGAFGAHGLSQRIDADLLEVYHTAVDYHMFHSLGLVAVGLLQRHTPSSAARWAGALFLAGIVVFSGSLYVLAVSGVRQLGMVTPVGGVAFLAGWIVFAFAAHGKRAGS
ncbi:MAG: DUF423 domain-containing protein [Gammaproteobacteria bacterium]|nr:DUF423 domain-containing protein [Gammaproteobacteria bacterium]